MTPTKQDVAIRRSLPFISAVPALFIFVLARDSSVQDGPYHSFVFGSTGDWPSWAVSFWPLDLGLSWAFYYGLMYLCVKAVTMTSKTPSEEPETFWTFVRFVAGGLFALGCFFGGIGSGLKGWYPGIEFFALGFAATAVIGGVIFLVIQIFNRALWATEAYLMKTLSRISETPG